MNLKPSLSTYRFRSSCIATIILFFALSITAQKATISYQSGKIAIQNNARTSLSFTLKNQSGEVLKSNIVVASRRKKYIPYPADKDLYKGLEVEYYYSKAALQNDIAILNGLISRREREKFWEDMFVGILSAADEYFTGGFFSNLKTGLEIIFETNDIAKREKALEELQLYAAKEVVKEKMTRTEKALLEGFIATIRSNLGDDKIVLHYKTQQAKLRILQPLSNPESFNSGRLVNKYIRGKFSISASLMDRGYNPDDSLEYIKPANSNTFSTDTPFRFRLNYDGYLTEGKDLNLSLGAYLGINRYPDFIFRNEQISLLSPTLGGSGKIIIGNSYGVSGGLDIGIVYNSLSDNILTQSELNRVGWNFAVEVSIFTPIFTINTGIDSNEFNRIDEEISNSVVSWYFGIEIPLATKNRYKI